MVMLVTASATAPVGVTVTRNGIVNGVAAGQPKNGATCVEASAFALIDTDEPLANVVGLVGLEAEPHEVSSNAALTSSGRAVE